MKKKNSPPKVASWLLSKLYVYNYHFESKTDFEAEYSEIEKVKGIKTARRWYWVQVLHALKFHTALTFKMRSGMSKNYFKTALNNLLKHKVTNFINIFGLTFAISSCFLVTLYILDDLKFDTFHENKDSIYRAVFKGSIQGRDWNNSRSPSVMGQLFKDELPEVEEYVRFQVPNPHYLVTYQDKKFYEKGFYFADASVFNVFSFELVEGDAEKVLEPPNAVVINESAVKKYFGNEDPIGKVITAGNNIELMVTGIMKDLPGNTHFKFDFLVNVLSQPNYLGLMDPRWSWSNYFHHTYFLLNDASNIRALEYKMTELVNANAKDYKDLNWDAGVYLQKVSDIHLSGNMRMEVSENSSKELIYVLIFIAVSVLFVACFNFINLSTAQSVSRIKEIGIRKVAGATKLQLVTQFISESYLTVALSVVLACGAVLLSLPYFNAFAGKEIVLGSGNILPVVMSVILLSFIIAFFSGSYPAVILSAYKPADAFRSKTRAGNVAPFVRKTLIVMQFSVAASLLLGMGTIKKQLEFIKNRDLGYNKDQIIALSTIDNAVRSNHTTLKDVYESHQSIETVSHVNALPGDREIYNPLTITGKPEISGINAIRLFVGYDFFETMGMELTAGRTFSKDFKSDSSAILLNEELVKQFGLTDPVGQRIGLNFGFGSTEHQIIGIVKNFNYKSLRKKIQPYVILLSRGGGNRTLVRVRQENISSTLRFMEKEWSSINPKYPFEYSFVDAMVAQLHGADAALGKIINYFGILALTISCLGLLGLVTFSVQQRTKEIGIRKVVGASVSKLFVILSQEYAILLGISLVMAVPFSLLVMQGWLSSFAYRAGIGIWIILSPVIILIFSALISISFQVLKTAMTNPVDVLRYE